MTDPIAERVIPLEAIEAAARAMYGTEDSRRWDDAHDIVKGLYRERAERAIAAYDAWKAVAP